MRFFAAGHGDAILLRTGAGAAVLVDAGRGSRLLLGDNLVERRIVPFLREHRLRQLDAFVITHPHADHFGDVGRLASAVTVKRFYVNPDGERTVQGIFEGLVPGARFSTLSRGKQLRFGALRLQVLHPPAGSVSPPGRRRAHEENNRSLVLRVTFGRVRFLLSGDLVTAGEHRLLATGQPLRADVLKLGHHGVGGGSAAWLRAVAPTYAVASCGPNWRHRQSRPRAALLRRLRAQGIRLLRTDQDGDVVFFTDGTKLRYHTEPQHRIRGR